MHLLDVQVMKNIDGVLFILYLLIYIYIMLNMVLHIQHLAEHFQKALEKKALEQKQDSTQNRRIAPQIKQHGGPIPSQPPIDKDTC